MKEKYYDFTSSFLTGIVFIILGIVLLIGKNQLYHSLVTMVVLVLLLKALVDMFRFFFRVQSVKKKKKIFLSSLFHFMICFLFSILPNFVLGIVPFLFAIYLIMIASSQFVMCFMEVKNGEFISIHQVLLGLIYFGIAIPIFCSPVGNLDNFLICFSIYVLLLGGSFLYDSVVRILSIKTRNRLKRKIRITLPKIVEAVIPYSMMLEINRNLEVHKGYCYSYCFDDDHRECNLHILVHTSSRGVNRMGHIDICFHGHVFSYGNYDEGSRFCHEIFGDGVLFVLDRKEDYINFCIDNSKKTIFDFGIHLTERQVGRVQKRIDELLDNTISWDYKQDKKYCHGKSYAAKLYKKTKAKFYKFKKGKYKTFFVLGTNCCFLVDDIIGKSGMDNLSLNGIITPGTYYDFLNRMLKVRSSNVISKEIYNFDRRAK